MTPERVAKAKRMLSRGCKIATVARTLGVSRASIYRCALYKMTAWAAEANLQGEAAMPASVVRRLSSQTEHPNR